MSSALSAALRLTTTLWYVSRVPAGADENANASIFWDPPEVAGAAAPWFRTALKDCGIQLHPRSGLATGLHDLEVYRERALREDLIKYGSAEELIQHQLRFRGIDFLSKALHWAEVRGWTAWRTRARMLLGGSVMSPAERSMDRDVAWEIVLGALCATFANNVALEEPDLTCEFEGERVGVAAKVLYSDSEERVLKTVVHGAKQGERADIARCTVVVNFAPVLPHAALYQHLTHAKVTTAKGISEVVDALVAAINLQHERTNWLRRLSHRGKLQSVVQFVPLVVPVEGSPVGIMYTNVGAGRGNEICRFDRALHNAFQQVMRHTP
jgi:hypothetical protein